MYITSPIRWSVFHLIFSILWVTKIAVWKLNNEWVVCNSLFLVLWLKIYVLRLRSKRILWLNDRTTWTQEPNGSFFSRTRKKRTSKKRARRIRLFQGVVRRRPPQFVSIIYHTGRNYARGFKNCWWNFGYYSPINE